MKALITLGGTREYIDDVRFITNLSTGKTGCIIAEQLNSGKYDITCLCAKGSKHPHGENIKTPEFTSFQDLSVRMKRIMQTEVFDAVIHLAAVSDYSVKSVVAGKKEYAPGAAGKIPSKAGEMTLVLKKNFKILDRIKDYAGKSNTPYTPLLIGFKLTSGASMAEITQSVKMLRRRTSWSTMI